ncbi:uncharacterized protein FOMMEDRAFT_137915 [Fomitiporia mediterranea MF3/22]|uniref:uncharacterized protein n=1 Tax=Fomitiporia mediterranea (strain MF3/22) TaxID=694068 RepID=UPI000440988B|nr:uncharacterized protein FOMMEDRAFT_137915 [Fomitiporia mediterranea MF3/22]EJD07689.1 hypothetical protein FOMMEDRAFT_137915 [Fomitiporia mediterranea MF3/22]
MSEEALSELHPLLQDDDFDSIPVYPIIHMIRQHFIDTPLSYDALCAPDLTYTLIKPLEDKYANIQRKGNYSVVFCFLLNRVNFLRDQNLVTSSLSRSRAALCELMANRLLRLYGDNTLELAFVTTTSWRVYSGADETLLKQLLEDLEIDDVEERVGNAIEMAIIGKAKRFIKSTACQRVIDSIWTGKCVYQAQSSHSILSDTYKQTPIHFYDPHKAPLLDHYRLKVPAIRSVLEYVNFLTLFILFVLVLEFNERDHLNWIEIVFMIYALGFTLEKVAAMQEHGLKVYFTGTWNGFDLCLITIFVSYASLRLTGFRYGNAWAKSSGIDCLALAACLLFPRLAFVTLKNNLMVLSLRAMIMQFVVLMFIAAFCFAGFLYALWTLARNDASYTAGDIFWWMADLWFGLDATGFALSSTFHPYFGPVLMISYACLSNTLLLTVLVSILSHTFASISEDAVAEAMFRRAVLTIEGVKADYLFSYQPPVNVIALCIMLPASYVLSPRWFHKVNVFMIRLTSFPLLLVIAYYERQAKQVQAANFSEAVSATAERVMETLPRSIKRMSFFEGFFAGKASDIDVIFDIEEEMMQANNEIALDTQEAESATSSKRNGALSQRRGSTASRRVSAQSARPMKIIPSNSSALSNASQDGQEAGSPPTPTKGFRKRLASAMQRGTEAVNTFTSPLAQIYQPLVVDDDIVEEEMASSPSQPAAPPMMSFAPGVRRRLSSMHRFPPVAPMDAQRRMNSSRGQNRDGHLLDDVMSEESPSSMENLVREQEERAKEEEGITPPEPASQVLEGGGEATPGGLVPQFADRLAKIEERQMRLEELILQLSEHLRSAK